MNDPKEQSQHDRDRLWRAVEDLAEKVDGLSHRFAETWERFTAGVHSTSNELRARIIVLEEGSKSASKERDELRADVKLLQDRNEREDKDWRDRAWKVILTVAIGYICLRLGIGGGK